MGSDHTHKHGDDHSHDHSHGFLGHGDGHAHGHSHAPADFGTAFLVGIVLNTGFVIVEATYGFLSGSMALVADAGHNLSDVLALVLAWGASVAAKRAPTSRYTYGFKSSTILAALANAMLLAFAIGAILFETVHRILEPAPVAGMTMVVIAGIGILINTGTALMFMRGRHNDLNIRGAFLHMAADALVSLGVVIAGLAIIYTGQDWIDPLTSLLIVTVIAWGTWGLAKESVRMGLLGVPRQIDQADVKSYLSGLDGVTEVEDLHIWPMSTTETALTAHLLMPAGHTTGEAGDAFLRDASAGLAERYGIDHATLQLATTPIEQGCC
ncbi:MAG: cation diffusion facilitator family transporter [Erythrobacter sp.]